MARNINQQLNGTDSLTAAKAIGIDQPNAAPSTTCGRWVYRFINGYTHANARAAIDNRMVIVFSVSTSKNEINTSTTNSARASFSVTAPLGSGRFAVRLT
ncbi:Uncharacterised protein [Shigella sonnei]|nr:Uncharacterised protein [Shigella sonnei]